MKKTKDQISGAELAKRLLGQPDVDRLIETLASNAGVGRESAILEFKASWKPLPEDNVSDEDCRWNVVKAIIAMANASGGCIVLGLAEDPHDKDRLVVGNADPDGVLKCPGKEGKDLAEHTKSQLLKGDGKFHAGDGTLVEISGLKGLKPMEMLKNLVEIHICKSNVYSTLVIVIIVDPIDDKSGQLFFVEKSYGKFTPSKKKKILYYRNSEHPKTEFLEDPQEIALYVRRRSIRKSEFAEILANARPTSQEIRRHKRMQRLFLVICLLLFVFLIMMLRENNSITQERDVARKDAEESRQKYDKTLEGRFNRGVETIKSKLNKNE